MIDQLDDGVVDPVAGADLKEPGGPSQPDTRVELAHLANVLGGLAVGVVDVQAAALQTATGLDLSAVAALTTLLDRPGSTIDALARVLGLTHSGAVRLADRMAAQGLVVRTAGADRRTAPLRLTGRGEEMASCALAARQQALQRLLNPLDTDHRAQLLELVTAVAGSLVRHREQARRMCRHCEHACCRAADCPLGSAVDET